MAVRATMANLIGRLRLLVGDPAGAAQTFADQDLQDVLDQRRSDVRYCELQAVASIAPGGAVAYLEYLAGRGDWEADEQLVDGSYNVLAPDTSDRLTGRWTFVANTPPPVYIVGKVYDLYAAAADVLEAWAAKEKLSFDVSADGQSLSRSQKVAALLAQAAQYRRQCSPLAVAQVRGDANP